MLLMQIYYISSSVDIYLNVSTHESRNYQNYGLQSSSASVISVFYLCGFEKILTNMETLASKILHDQSWATLNSEKKISICFVTTSIINDTFADVLDIFIGG